MTVYTLVTDCTKDSSVLQKKSLLIDFMFKTLHSVYLNFTQILLTYLTPFDWTDIVKWTNEQEILRH